MEGQNWWEHVVERHLDWRFWYGALGLATGLVTATKPTGEGSPPQSGGP
jgi:hypothetical protein